MAKLKLNKRKVEVGGETLLFRGNFTKIDGQKYTLKDLKVLLNNELTDYPLEEGW